MTTPHATRQIGRIEGLSQRSRRIIGVATLAGLPLMFVWSAYWMGTSVSNIVWGPISFLLIGATVVGSFILYRFVRDRTDLRGRGLDERERQLRDRAWILSYQVLSVVAIAGVTFVALQALLFERPVTIDAGLASALVLCVAVLLPVLPVAALAWIEPDMSADE